MVKIMVIGRLGKDPVTREVGDSDVCHFTVAGETGYGDNKETQWFDVSVWGSHGKACQQYLAKGSQVFVEGELALRRNGEYVNLDIKRAQVKFLGPKAEEAQEAGRSKSKDKAKQQRAKQQTRRRQEEPDDDIPF